MSARDQSRWRARSLAALTAVCGLLALPCDAAAQRQLASVQGTVTDQSGAVLPGVTMTVTNQETGEVRATTSNEVGIYRILSLDPGRYDLVAELSGFSKAGRTGVVVSAGSTVGLNLTMETGALTETVDVSAIAPDIQTERAEVSSLVERQKVVDLPIAGRNPMALVALQPGVTGLPTGADIMVGESGLPFNANGQRQSGNNAVVDGLSINGNPWGGTALIMPNVESVQEMQIIANNPSAEYGRNVGAAVSIITRGGTNEFRGSAFEFHRNNDLRAREFFEDEKGDQEKNNFGFSIGGPIRRNSTFFFASYEGVRENSGEGRQYTVETERLRDWVMATRPDSKAAFLLDTYRPPAYPVENLQDLGTPMPGAGVWSDQPDGIMDVGTINQAVIGRHQGDQINGRLDQVLGDGDKLRASYYMTRLDNEQTHLRQDFNHGFPHRNQFFNVGYTRILSPQTLNELSFGFVRMHGEASDPTPQAPTIREDAGSGVDGFGVTFWHPIDFTQNNFELKNTLTSNLGRHSLRMGGELRYASDDSTLHHWERPNYGFEHFLDFVDDEPFSEERAVDPTTGLSTFAQGDYRTTEWALFIQDNWKLRSNVTLNLGLRYENFGNPSKGNAPFTGIILGEGATRQAQMRNARVGTLDQLYDTDWNNFAPRVGVAWDVNGRGSWVVRGGAGISYNRINDTVFSDERLNPPLFAHASVNVQDGVPIVYTLGPDYPENPALGAGLDEFGAIRGARVDLRVIDPETTIPHAYNWFAGIQRQLPWRFALEASYIGSAGRNLMSGDGPGGEDYNRFAGDLLDDVRDRIHPTFGDVGLAESRIDTEYHGLAVGLTRRFNEGFAFQASYTLGKAMDHPGTAEEVTNLERDWGPADHDVRHKLAINTIWEIPYQPTHPALQAVLGGWQLNSITIWQSGSPFNVVCGFAYPECDFNADGNNEDRPNVPSFGTSLPSLSRDEWLAGAFGVDNFPLPSAGTLGALPRNAYYGPGYVASDLSLFKSFRLGRVGSNSPTVQLRLEAYNLLNTVNLDNPEADIDDANFGLVTATRGRPSFPDGRVLQIGAKFMF
ncbi:MAG: TonB-dependent receptor [Vicinamibacteraceae bacterium]